jgi:uncharacterized protein
MIDGAFLHFKGIGKKTRENLFRLGIIDWSTAEEFMSKIPFQESKRNNLFNEITENKNALNRNDIAFFVNKFHPEDKWRILAHYFEQASYFDIETDGVYNRITTIALYHKGKLYNFTKNINLDEFLDLLEDVKLIVSFNGSSFDVPVVVQNFRIQSFPVPHLDLRWICYHEGIRGGLKQIERNLSIKRPTELEGVDGLEAIQLWYRWSEYNDKEALARLIKYCSADVLSLVKLTEKILSKKLKSFSSIDDGEIWSLIS